MALKLKRKEDWEKRLDQAIERARKEGFKWGTHDCVMFSANCAKAMTGTDPAKGYRGKYRSEEGAARALEKYGKGTIRKTITSILGKPLPSAMKAQRGDIVLVNTPEGPAAGVVDLSGRRAVVSGRNGLVFLPMRDWICAWKVGG